MSLEHTVALPWWIKDEGGVIKLWQVAHLCEPGKRLIFAYQSGGWSCPWEIVEVHERGVEAFCTQDPAHRSMLEWLFQVKVDWPGAPTLKDSRCRTFQDAIDEATRKRSESCTKRV